MRRTFYLFLFHSCPPFPNMCRPRLNAQRSSALRESLCSDETIDYLRYLGYASNFCRLWVRVVDGARRVTSATELHGGVFGSLMMSIQCFSPAPTQVQHHHRHHHQHLPSASPLNACTVQSFRFLPQERALPKIHRHFDGPTTMSNARVQLPVYQTHLSWSASHCEVHCKCQHSSIRM